MSEEDAAALDHAGHKREHVHQEPAGTADRKLVRAAQAGDTQALEQLFRRHWPATYRAAFFVVHDGSAAEDIAQEAFLAAIRALNGFDRRRPFAPWLHRITVNRAIDFARARALRREVGFESPSHAGDGAPPEAWSDDLTAALGHLDPEHRAVVVLRYMLEYTPGEIAKLLDLPRGTVNSRMRRALDRLGEAMEGERR